MSGRTAATHGDAGPMKPLADRGRRGGPARHRSCAGSKPWAYKSAARSTSTAPPYEILCRSNGAWDRSDGTRQGF